MTSAPVAPTLSVSPSGGALASTVKPSEPPAPGLFSTTTCRPSRGPSSLAIVRAMPSADAPGANGTMICMGFCAVCASSRAWREQQRQQKSTSEQHHLSPVSALALASWIAFQIV